MKLSLSSGFLYLTSISIVALLNDSVPDNKSPPITTTAIMDADQVLAGVAINGSRQIPDKRLPDRQLANRLGLNLIDSLTIQDDPCLHVGSCEYNNGSKAPGCYCDVLCKQLNDCCFDYDQNSLPASSVDIDSMNWSCYSLTSNAFDTSYAMVTGCSSPFHFSDEVKTNCATPTRSHDGITPVSADDGISYINGYCALCNGVTGYQFWHLGVDIDSCEEEFEFNLDDVFNISNGMSKLKLLIKHNGCRLVPVPPDNMPIRTCYANLTESRTEVENTDHKRRLCLAYQNPYHIGNHVYANYFCSAPEDLEKSGCYDFNIRKSTSGPRILDYGLFPAIFINGSQECSGGGIYEPSFEICVPSDCFIEQSGCFPSIFKNFYIEETFYFSAKGSVHEEFFPLLLALYYNLLPVREFHPEVNIKITHSTYKDRFEKESIHLNVLSVTMRITAPSLDADHISMFLALEEEIKLMEFSYTEKSITSKPQFPVVTKTPDYPSVPENMAAEHRTEELTNDDVRRLQTRVHMGIFYGNRLLKVPVSIKLGGNFFVNARTNRNALLVTSWLTYFSRPKQPTVLSETFIHGMKLKIITYVTMGLSSLALIGTIVAFLYVGRVNKTAARISINMMGTMLNAHVLFLFGIGANDFKIVCLVVGILIHYSWLSCFCWMTCFVVNAAIDFEKMRKYPAKILSPSRKISLYIYGSGYGIPLLLVIPSLVLEFYPGYQFNISHTGEACFIQGYPWSIIFFSAPVLVTLIVNVLCAFVSIRSISKFMLNSNNVSSIAKSLHTSLGAYMKLFLLSGCSWSLGLLNDVINNDIMRYIYVLLSGSHGLFVCLCFVCSPSFFQQLKFAFLRRNGGSQNTPLSVFTKSTQNKASSIEVEDNI